MSSAEGAVQHLNYTATFPLLLNISDQPTYFMALKDSAELVKMYAMVNVRDYQITATGTSVAACQNAYQELLVENGISLSKESEKAEQAGQETAKGTIAEKMCIRDSLHPVQCAGGHSDDVFQRHYLKYDVSGGPRPRHRYAGGQLDCCLLYTSRCV